MRWNKIFLWVIACLLISINSSFIIRPVPDVTHLNNHTLPPTTTTTDFDTIRADLGDYLWPTDASTRITSSFAEYRTNHFHGGIDISTNGQTGYKIFSVRDGYVYRIWIAPNGYGKMLFVKHPDGYISTYAHLQSFSRKINDVARREQYRKGTYAINLLLDSAHLAVTKGEVIAYSGDTGFGPPHIHFEIRDENLNPVNPLLLKNYSIADNVPPVIRRIMVSPLSYQSSVNDRKEPKYFSRFPRSGGILRIPQPIRVHGHIGFAIDTEDRSNGTWGETGIHRIEFFIDDSLTYSMELNRVPAEETKQIDLQYDLTSFLAGHGRFQKLYIERGNRLPFYDHKPEGTGIIYADKLTEGEHRYRAVVMDIQGNKNELHGTIIANHNPMIEMTSYNENEIYLDVNNVTSINKCFLYGKRTYQPNWSQHTLGKERFEVADNTLRLPINTKPYDVIKIVAETKSGSLSAPLYRFIRKPTGPARDVHISAQTQQDCILFTLTTPGVFTEIPELTVHNDHSSQSIKLDAVDLSKYEGLFEPNTSFHGTLSAQVSAEINGKPASASSDFTLFAIPADQQGSFTFDDSNLIISYDSGAVYKPIFLRINRDAAKQSLAYTFEPTDVLLNHGFRVTIPIGSENISNQTALYYRSTGGWIFQTCQPDSDRLSFSTIMKRTLGEIALLRDDTPPSIGRVRTSIKRGFINISFRYYDNLSGVDTDEIKLYIDNNLVIPEIDGEHHRVFYVSEEQLDTGKHTVRISIKDKMSNEMEYSRNLTIR